jgi:hypothetical protein
LSSIQNGVGLGWYRQGREVDDAQCLCFVLSEISPDFDLKNMISTYLYKGFFFFMGKNDPNPTDLENK